MNPIRKMAVRRRSSERELAEEMQSKLLEAGWAPPWKVSLLRDALDHIRRTCYRSRTQTRRLRFISRRAELALNGEPYTEDAVEEPKSVPNVASLEKQLRHAQREGQALAELCEEAARTIEELDAHTHPGVECDAAAEGIRERMREIDPAGIAAREARVAARTLEQEARKVAFLFRSDEMVSAEALHDILMEDARRHREGAERRTRNIEGGE